MSKRSITIDLQNESGCSDIPDISQFEAWVHSTLQEEYKHLEQPVRITTEEEIQLLNQTYRNINKPTNVLSFPAEGSEYLDYDYLGDLIICAPIVKAEARQQQLPLESHWAHMVVHGMLHLQGFDHLDDESADIMESLESEILLSSGYPDPYLKI